MTARSQRALFLAAIVASASLFAKPDGARANDESHAPGTWKKLAVRRFDVQDESNFDDALKDIPRLLRHFKPAGAEVSNLSIESVGPKKLPRVSFKAKMHVDVTLGPVHVSRDEEIWVRADVTARAGKCAYDATKLGYEVKLDLTSSDEPLSANVSNMVASFCVDPVADDGVRHVEVTNFMQVGPDYGTRVAGQLATNMLVKQTDPIVTALRESLVTARAATGPQVTALRTVETAYH